MKGVGELKLKRATYRHIEAEIFAYKETLKAIEELRRDIILAGKQEELAVSGGGYVGSIVERRATRLADSILLKEMERITRAITDVYSRTKEEARRVIWVKYGLAIDWQPPEELVAKMKGRNRFDMSVREMADMIPIAESTFYAYRTGFVYGVAERLGWY
ncbi:phage transcriptional activator, RinA family [Carboxydocella thermautotrophica]|nr:phage transcriptional activator, RinA family [Carboxydocella thermautotrophica]